MVARVLVCANLDAFDRDRSVEANENRALPLASFLRPQRWSLEVLQRGAFRGAQIGQELYAGELLDFANGGDVRGDVGSPRVSVGGIRS